LKFKFLILITLVDFAELLTDFSYTNFTVGLSNVDALDRLRVHLNIILFTSTIFQKLTYRSDPSADFSARWRKRRGLTQGCAFWG